MDLNIGWQFDLAIAVLVAVIFLLVRVAGRLGEMRGAGLLDQDLAKDHRVVRVPIRTSDDWDWPGR